MEYIPLKGRWATVSFFAVIALGATALSLHVDSKLSSRSAIPAQAVDQTSSEGNSASDQAIIVNPDGSIRDSEAALPMPDEANEDIGSDPGSPEAEAADDPPDLEETADRGGGSELQSQQAAAGRIE